MMSCPTCTTPIGSSEKINFSRKVRAKLINLNITLLLYSLQAWHKGCFRCKVCNSQLNAENAKMRDDENHSLYCVRYVGKF